MKKCELCNEKANNELVGKQFCDKHFDEVVKYSNIIKNAMEKEEEQEDGTNKVNTKTSN